MWMQQRRRGRQRTTISSELSTASLTPHSVATTAELFKELIASASSPRLELSASRSIPPGNTVVGKSKAVPMWAHRKAYSCTKRFSEIFPMQLSGFQLQ